MMGRFTLDLDLASQSGNSMRPTETLADEHRWINVALRCLECLVDASTEQGCLHPQVAEVTTFLRIFADESHHGKEERLLFPALETRGLPRANGPTGVMAVEHAIRAGIFEPWRRIWLRHSAAILRPWWDSRSMPGPTLRSCGSISRRKTTACSPWPTAS